MKLEVCRVHLKSPDQLFKKNFVTPAHTPRCAIRLETEATHLEYDILKAFLLWMKKVFAMPEHRLPRVCLHKLHAMSTLDSACPEHNWILQLIDFFVVHGLEKLCPAFDSVILTNNKEIILQDFISISRQLTLINFLVLGLFKSFLAALHN